jgi:hypothetical protein
MAKLFPRLIAFGLLLAPLSVRADGIIEASVGSGYRWQPSPRERVPTNIMLAGGYSFGVAKLELGVLGNLTDVQNSKFDVDLRPMLLIKPPALPIYARGILGVTGLVQGPAALSYGGALGVRLGGLGVGVFLEAGAITRQVEIANVKTDTWIAEGRLGVYWD